MGKYFKLLRLDDQYIEFIAALSGGIFIHARSVHIFLWALSTVCLGISVYMTNELADRRDADRFTWNPAAHITMSTRLDMRVVGVLFASFSLIGLGMSWVLGYFWWGLAIWFIGICYSLPPIRLKGRVVVDIASQLFAGWVGPFLAPVWAITNHWVTLVFVIIISLLIGVGIFPYQLADIEADAKAGLRGTHVVLGLRRSLWLGFAIGAVGGILYLLFLARLWLWTIPMFIPIMIVMVYYVYWLRMSTATKQLASLRRWVKIFKPVSLIIFPLYIACIWWFV